MIKYIKKETILKVLLILIMVSTPLLINLTFFKPTKLNAFIATKIYKAPANSAFVDNNFYKCVVDAYNSKNKTNIAYTESLSGEQLGTITSLSCTDKEIVSTNGLEKVIKLTTLNVSFNQLETLDISGNPTLIKLHAAYNKLSELNLSKNTSLTNLDVSSNKLTELNLSQNTSLTNLDVSYNQLIELDIIKNASLINLSLISNELTKLDVSSNTALTNLDVSYNQLSELNTSKNTTLTKLIMHTNKLTNIDISNNPALTELVLSSNELTTLDMSKNLELTTLRAENNKLIGVDISKNLKLVSLNLRVNNLSRLEIKNNTNLRFLSVEINKLVELDVSNNTALEKIDVSDNYLTTFDLSNHAALKELNVSNNILTSLNISQSNKISSLELKANRLETLILNKDFNIELFKKIGTQQKRVISVVIGEKVIEPSNNANLYINNKLVILNNIEIENIANELGLKNLTAKIYNGSEEVTAGIIKEGYVLKIYDGEIEIQNLEITVHDNLMSFTDPNFYRCVVDNYNKQNNTNITYSETLNQEQLNNISRLSCNQKNIVSTCGLEKITNLNSLVVSNNKLTDIDLSKNTNLTYLDVSWNELSDIDISNNKKLTELHVSSNNLNTLDISNAIELTRLDSRYTNLTALDISNNRALKILNVERNLLTKIDVSKNPLLNYLNINDNQLINIDVSNNTALKNLNVERNLLTKIDVSKNPLLNYLNISDNQISQLNISNNTILESLSASQNQLSHLDVNNNQNLNYLSLNYNQLSELDLNNNIVLETLNVRHNQLAKIDIKNNILLKQLDVAENQIADLDLSKNTELSELIVYNNPYEKTLVIYKGVDTKINKSFIKFSPTIISTITSISSEHLISNESEKTIKSQETGIYSALVSYEHNIFKFQDNSFSGKYKVKVIEMTSDKYKISNEDSFVYVGIDNDVDIIKSNLNISEEVDINIDLHTNKLQIIWQDEILKEFNVIRYNSDIYDLNKEYIYTGTEGFNLENVQVINSIKEVKDNKLIIKYKEDILKEYLLINYNSNTYNLSKDYIYTGTGMLNLSKIEVINAEKEIKDNKLLIKYKEDILKEYLLINYNSNIYNLSKDYIYTGTRTLDLSKIEVINAEKEINDSKLLIKYNKEILKEYLLINISTEDYAITEEYIYTGLKKIELDKINVTNATKIVEENKLIIKYSNEKLEEFLIFSYYSDVYDLTNDYIYMINKEFDLKQINTINLNAVVKEKELIIKYDDKIFEIYSLISLNINTYKVCSNLIVIPTGVNASYEEFTSNITTNGVTYKIFDGEKEVISGNVTKGMKLKVYLNEELIDEYQITDEYLEFDDSLNIDEDNKMIFKLREGMIVSDILTKINTSGEIKIKNKAGNIIDDDDIIGTGYKMQIALSSGTIEYTLIISGDVTGDGIVNISDVIKIADHTISRNILTDYEELAAEVTNDTSLNIADVLKIADYTLDKRIEIWR